MEGLGGSGFSGMSSAVKKKRSAASRRPRSDSQLAFGSHDISPLSSAPSSDNSNKLSPDQSEVFPNNTALRMISVDKFEGISSSKKARKGYKAFDKSDRLHGNGVSTNKGKGLCWSDLKSCSEAVVPSANWKCSSKGKDSSSGHSMHHVARALEVSSENKLRKVKLKIGGVTRTIHTKSDLETSNGNSSGNPGRSSDSSQQRQKLISQDNFNGNLPEKLDDLQGDPRNDSGGVHFSCGAKEGPQSKGTKEILAASSDPVRKSKRVPKKRVLDGSSDDGEEDDEIRYLERLKNSKFARNYSAECEEDRDDIVKKSKISKVSKSRNTAYDVDEEYGMSQSTKESRRKSRSGSNDMDYGEVEKSLLDDELEANGKQVALGSSTDVRAEPLMTTRQRALQSSKDGVGSSLIEFPNGLPPAPPRRQKEKLSEEEQQAKKAEAAQRRKMQVEKAAKESEAMAIRKILGLDSDKKKAEKEKARAEKVKAANYQILAPNTVRLVMGPNGTVLTFPEDVDLLAIFDSKPCSYPPPREKCAGPSCTNAYKYRDSRSNLPLCSLQCYRAVQGSSYSVTC